MFEARKRIVKRRRESQRFNQYTHQFYVNSSNCDFLLLLSTET